MSKTTFTKDGRPVFDPSVLDLSVEQISLEELHRRAEAFQIMQEQMIRRELHIKKLETQLSQQTHDISNINKLQAYISKLEKQVNRLTDDKIKLKQDNRDNQYQMQTLNNQNKRYQEQQLRIELAKKRQRKTLSKDLKSVPAEKELATALFAPRGSRS